MRLYLVSGPGAKRYAGTQADARKARQEIVDKIDCKKAEVTIEEVDVPTSKPGLLETLNALAKEADLGE